MATPTGITDTTTTSVIIAGTGTIMIKKSAVFLCPSFREQLADLDLPSKIASRESQMTGPLLLCTISLKFGVLKIQAIREYLSFRTRIWTVNKLD